MSVARDQGFLKEHEHGRSFSKVDTSRPYISTLVLIQMFCKQLFRPLAAMAVRLGDA